MPTIHHGSRDIMKLVLKVAPQIKVTVKYHNWRKKKCIYYFGLSQRLVFYTSHNSGKHVYCLRIFKCYFECDGVHTTVYIYLSKAVELYILNVKMLICVSDFLLNIKEHVNMR